jgi:glycosyltransferase 2 family protein
LEEFFSRSLNRKNLVRGTVFFILCTIIGLSISFLWSGTAELGTVLRSIRGKYLVLAILCMFADWLSGSARFFIFARQMSPRVRYFDAFRANLATLCVGGITPLQTGGVGHIYIFNRVGVPISGGMTTGIITFIGTLTILIASTGAVVLWNPDFLPKGITFVSQYSLVMFILCLLFFILLVIKPEALLYPLAQLRVPNRRGLRFIARTLDRLLVALDRLISEHKAFTRMFITEHKTTCALSFVLTGCIYMSRFVGGYVVMLALGGNAPFWDVIAAQVLLNFVTLFAPSPGASGIAEFLTAVLMKKLVPVGGLGVYALMTRFFVTYCGVGVGGIVLVSQLTTDFKEQSIDKESDSDTLEEY